MGQALRCTSRSRWMIALFAPLLLSCDSATPPETTLVTERPMLSVSAEDLEGAALFVGNLVPGAPTGNGILRYDGAGTFIDHFAPGGCCMSFGSDEHLYVARALAGVYRHNGVTGEFMKEFVPPDPARAMIPFIPVLGPDGHLYVSDRGATRAIRRYNVRTGELMTDFFVDGTARAMGNAQFFAFGPDGHIYWASSSTNRVLRFNGSTGAFIDEFVSAGEGGLNSASGLAFGPDGILYVSSPDTDRVLRFDRDGNYIGDFFAAGSGGLDLPVGITFGPDGNFYVASAATPQTGSVLRYNGVTGEFIDAFVPSGGRATGPRTLHFKSKIAMCHRPPGNPSKAKTISIGYLSAREHVDHGDDVGACAP
jgi:outer membrane protein assembly factor BamB